jgi:hypothetical protein
MTNEEVIKMNWQLQTKNDILDAVQPWDFYRFVCVLKDNSIRIFTGMCDETDDGQINQHLDCTNDEYKWDFDDIIMWIEVPTVRVV